MDARDGGRTKLGKVKKKGKNKVKLKQMRNAFKTLQ